MRPELYKTYHTTCQNLGIKHTSPAILIDLKSFLLELVKGEDIIKSYSVSLSKNPPSCINGSLGTPSGLHEICDKIGHDEPLGSVFKGRLPVGKHFSEMPDEEQKGNLITSRILRLRGLEQGRNAGEYCDTFDRLVYIHGTNHEDKIGQPLTAGCPVLTNAEIVDLFDRVESGCHVYIG